MEPTQIILKPMVTEKSTFMSGQNRHAFHVDMRARKGDIKRAVEELYKVRVLSVNTKVRRGQMRRNRFGMWRTSDQKHAIVKVHPDDRIELF
jgi:large subunit ribosomal protein L23